MIKPLVLLLSNSVLPFSLSFTSYGMKLLDVSQLTGLCPLACTDSLYQHSQCPTPLYGVSTAFIKTICRNLLSVPLAALFFPLHAFFQESVTTLLLLYTFLIGITSICLEIVSGSVCSFMMYSNSDAGVRKQ